ncbi:MAG: PD-(D/E)XK nuclease family protein, partial [Polyangiales bacterium]
QGKVADRLELRATLRQLAGERFDVLAEQYPFANTLVRQAQRKALSDQLDKLLQLDWDVRQRRFVAVERSFGYDEPCQLETDSGPLFVRGKIDKLDLAGSRLLVRDIKTGAGKPRRADSPPELDIDLQLGLYALVAKRMAKHWKTPSDVGVAYLYLRSGEPLRSWIGDDYPQLEAAVLEWLAIARETLESGAFVRSPQPEDCRYCPYQPVCAPEMPRAQQVLDDPEVPSRLAVLKGGEAR